MYSIQNQHYQSRRSVYHGPSEYIDGDSLEDLQCKKTSTKTNHPTLCQINYKKNPNALRPWGRLETYGSPSLWSVQWVWQVVYHSDKGAQGLRQVLDFTHGLYEFPSCSHRLHIYTPTNSSCLMAAGNEKVNLPCTTPQPSLLSPEHNRIPHL
jgi:hypothetical protein